MIRVLYMKVVEDNMLDIENTLRETIQTVSSTWGLKISEAKIEQTPFRETFTLTMDFRE